MKQPATNPARLACCQTTSESVTVRPRIALAPRVSSIRCGRTSTERTVDGTGICLMCGLSIPTAQHQPAVERRRDVVDVRRAARDLLALHRELQQAQVVERLVEQRVGRDDAPATADAADPPSPEPSGMPFSMVNSKPKSSAERLGHAPPPPSRRCSARTSSGRSVTTPRDRGDADAAGRGAHARARDRRRTTRCSRARRSRRRRCRRSPARTRRPCAGGVIAAPRDRRRRAADRRRRRRR